MKKSHNQKIDVFIPKKRSVKFSSVITEEAYKDLVWIARENEQTISLTLEKAIASHKKCFLRKRRKSA